jgi:hydroxymethylpyrimidine pyrophosphatase-like HAD family hydrolase
VQIRAVVTDLDGTMVGQDARVSAAMVRAGRDLMNNGIALIAATARTFNGLAILRPLMTAVIAAVCCNGSLGYDTFAGRSLSRHMLCAATVAAIVSIVSIVTTDLPDAGLGSFDGGNWILTEESLATWAVNDRRTGETMAANQEAN